MSLEQRNNHDYVKNFAKKIYTETNMIVRGSCPYMQFKDWQNENCFAAFSTRIGGVSKGDCASMNLSFQRDTSEEDVWENYSIISKSMNIDMDRICCANQMHTNIVEYVSSNNFQKFALNVNSDTVCDGLITDDETLILTAFFADCVPIFVYNKKVKAVGMLHAGWKGTVNDIVAVGLKTISDSQKDVKVAIGPSISAPNYEVGIDVAQFFYDKYSKKEADDIIQKKNDYKFYLDLWKANEYNLLYQGVDRKNIVQGNVCTYKFHDYLFSHRYTKGKRGNLAGFIKLKKTII